MGGIKDIIAMLPGMGGKLKIREEDIDEKKILMVKAIIQSMTMKERENPSIINSSRKNRIAKGSGTTVQDVNRVLKQFEQTKLMMKQMKNNKMFRF
jgi:signal recognition particle subunit SRP54